MSKYNVSKREAKRLGIARVRIGGGSGGGGHKKSRSFKLDTGHLDSLVGKLANSYQPTQEENATTKHLDNLMASEEMGINKIKENPMASSLVRGQSNVLRNQVLAQATPLTQRLARIQARRQGATDALRASLMGEQAKLGLKTQAWGLNEGSRQFDQSFGLQNKQFSEGVRQFNKSFGLQQQRENRLRSGGGSVSDTDGLNYLLTGNAPTAPKNDNGFTSNNPATNTNPNFPRLKTFNFSSWFK